MELGDISSINLIPPVLDGERRKLSDCDFQIQIQWHDSALENKAQFDWSYTLDVPDGGVILSQDALLYGAPEKGYKPHYEFVVKAADPNRENKVQQTFYVKSRRGQVYAAITLNVACDAIMKKGSFRVNGFVNPHGSRNLEPGAPILNP